MSGAPPTAAVPRLPGAPSSLSIVLPAYQEAGVIAAVVRDARAAGRAVADAFEILVVDDGSTDGTADVLGRLAGDVPELRALRHGRNQGYGAAVRTGFAAARGDWVFQTDADGQFPLVALPALVPPLHRGFDAVCGYRQPRRDAWPRRLNGWAWSRLTALALGHPLRDVNCAFKLFPRAFLQSVDTRATAAAFPAELVAAAAARRLRIAEVGVPHRARRQGRATGNRLDVVGRGLLELGVLAAARWRRATRPGSVRGSTAGSPAADPAADPPLRPSCWSSSR